MTITIRDETLRYEPTERLNSIADQVFYVLGKPGTFYIRAMGSVAGAEEGYFSVVDISKGFVTSMDGRTRVVVVNATIIFTLPEGGEECHQ